MNFQTALLRMQEGYLVRRPEWSQHRYWYIVSGNDVIFDKHDTPGGVEHYAVFTTSDLLGEDWEIFQTSVMTQKKKVVQNILDNCKVKEKVWKDLEKAILRGLI